jgi:hypothetical protein
VIYAGLFIYGADLTPSGKKRKRPLREAQAACGLLKACACSVNYLIPELRTMAVS